MSIFSKLVVVVVSVFPKASPKFKFVSVWNSPNWVWVLVLKSKFPKSLVALSALKVLVSTIFVVFVSKLVLEFPKSNWALVSNPSNFVSVVLVVVVPSVWNWFKFTSEEVSFDWITFTVANSSVSRLESPWKKLKLSAEVASFAVVWNWVSKLISLLVVAWNWLKSWVDSGTEVVLSPLIALVTLYSPKDTGWAFASFINVSIL